ncbi:DUF4214 domain-containing protein [Massilia horti]|nr:DUF4214 domain-containing protein [Massilia horti]
MADTIMQLQKLYVTYFSRPADPEGLQFWNNALINNPNMYQRISQEFSESPEYQSKYANMNNQAVITTVYHNLFSREPDPEGLAFWTRALNSGDITIATAASEIAAGAQTADRIVFNGKVAAATSFTDHVDQPNEIKAYMGQHAFQLALDYIASIKDLASAAYAMDPGVIDSVISTIVSDAGMSAVSPGMAQLVGVQDFNPPPLGV